MRKFTSYLLCAVMVLGYVVIGVEAQAYAQYSGVIYEVTAAEKEDAVGIVLSDKGVTVDGGAKDAVFVSHDIVYYQDRDTYEGGNPYGEGTASERHSAQEADAHTVVNITAPGTYRVSGTLSAGQLRIDLGERARYDPQAVVNLILDNVDITCTVAPAILFQNVYECDGFRSIRNATPDVDTADAGANLILAMGSVNQIRGSHVAKIYKDNHKQKKLVKQDCAIYSYMSMNVDGCGELNLFADNEGLGTELHLTIRNGSVNIRAMDDGINVNEKGVSVVTILAGDVRILSGLSTEGDGIDSNGYVVIRGGCVISAADPNSDSGLDGDKGQFIHGGTVISLGSNEDWLGSGSEQVSVNLQFAEVQNSAIVMTDEAGGVVFGFDFAGDQVMRERIRGYKSVVISSPEFAVGETYRLYLGGSWDGQENCGFLSGDLIDGTQQRYAYNKLRHELFRDPEWDETGASVKGSVDFCMHTIVNSFSGIRNAE